MSLTNTDWNVTSTRGFAGEADLVKIYPELSRTDGMNGDHTFKDGSLLELKTDSYTSENFFIELFGNIRKKSPGGVHQAKENGCKYFMFYFPNLKLTYLMLVDEMLEVIDAIKDGKRKLKIKNKTHSSEGFTVNRKEFLKKLMRCRVDRISDDFTIAERKYLKFGEEVNWPPS